METATVWAPFWAAMEIPPRKISEKFRSNGEIRRQIRVTGKVSGRNLGVFAGFRTL
jgi:hypothetical protein